MKDIEDQIDDGSFPIDSLEIAAIVINGYALQGRIRPTSQDDIEVETLLAQLSILVMQYEKKIASK
jgi:hypothetical protein